MTGPFIVRPSWPWPQALPAADFWSVSEAARASSWPRFWPRSSACSYASSSPGCSTMSCWCSAVSSFVSSVAAILLGNLVHQPDLVLAASVLYLIPGVPLIDSIEELIRGYVTVGLTRGIMGIAHGGVPGVRHAACPQPEGDVLMPWGNYRHHSSQGSVRGHRVHGVRRSVQHAQADSAWCGILGFTGMGLRTLGLSLGFSLEHSTLLGATVVGFVSFIPHHRLVLPTHVVSIPGTINMVPGVFAFKAMTGFMTFSTSRIRRISLPPATICLQRCMC